MEFQTRTFEGDIEVFPTLREAMASAKVNHDVWKVSFNLPSGDNVRLLRRDDDFIYTTMDSLLP